MGRDAASKVDTLLRTHIERVPASAAAFDGDPAAKRIGKAGRNRGKPLKFTL
jgi:hypothetical protein